MLIRPLLHLFWMLLILLPLHSQAANNPAVVLRNLHASQLILPRVAASFHQYQGAKGDARQLARLNADLVALKTTLSTTFRDLNDLGLAQDLAALKGHWQGAARHLNTAVSAISGRGFAEGQVVNEYLLNNLKAAKDLEKACADVLALTGFKLAPALQALRDQTLLMQNMMALYMEKSHSPRAYDYRHSLGAEENLNPMAVRFRHGLDALPASSDNARRLADVRAKWQFLEKSFLNSDHNAVPYLVLKFGPGIIDTLQEMTASIDAG